MMVTSGTVGEEAMRCSETAEGIRRAHGETLEERMQTRR